MKCAYCGKDKGGGIASSALPKFACPDCYNKFRNTAKVAPGSSQDAKT